MTILWTRIEGGDQQMTSEKIRDLKPEDASVQLSRDALDARPPEGVLNSSPSADECGDCHNCGANCEGGGNCGNGEDCANGEERGADSSG